MCNAVNVVFSVIAFWHALCGGGKTLNARNADSVRHQVRQLPTDTPLDTFVADYMNIRTWEDKRQLVKDLRKMGKRAYNAGLWDGVTPTWEYPLPLDMIVLDNPPKDYNEGQSIGGETAQNPDEVVYIYPEDQDTEGERTDYTVCDQSSLAYYTGNVLVTATGCDWSNNITVTGYLYISGALTIFNSSSSKSVEIQGVTSNNSITVTSTGSLTVSAPTSSSNLYTRLTAADDSWIRIYGSFTVNASNDTNNEVILDCDPDDSSCIWYGVYAQTGGYLDFNGDSSDQRISLQKATGRSGYACIYHRGGDSSSNLGALDINGVVMPDCIYSGVKLDSWSGSNYMTSAVLITYCDIDSAYSGIEVANTPGANNYYLSIHHNSITNYGTTDTAKNAISVSASDFKGSVLVNYNTISGVSNIEPGSKAIYIDDVTYGNVTYYSQNKIQIDHNTIDSVADAIYVGQHRAYSHGTTSFSGSTYDLYYCKLLITNNDISDVHGNGIEVLRTSGTTGDNYLCAGPSSSDYLTIYKNTIFAYNSSPTFSSGTGVQFANYLRPFGIFSNGTSVVDENTIGGFNKQLYLSDTDQKVAVTQNIFSFEDEDGNNANESDSERSLVELSDNAENHGLTFGGATGEGNCFKHVYDVNTFPYAYHASGPAGAGTDNICEYNDFPNSDHTEHDIFESEPFLDLNCQGETESVCVW